MQNTDTGMQGEMGFIINESEGVRVCGKGEMN